MYQPITKLPPIEKIAEAYSAIADKRVHQLDDNIFKVVSSNNQKEYTVIAKNNYYKSDDNASKFAHYAGYPILAVLMYKDILPTPKQYIHYFKYIDWNTLNQQFKRNYAQSFNEAMKQTQLSPNQIEEIKEDMISTLNLFASLNIKI